MSSFVVLCVKAVTFSAECLLSAAFSGDLTVNVMVCCNSNWRSVQAARAVLREARLTQHVKYVH